MMQLQVAIYARVSNVQQAEAGTIKSQIEALRNQIITNFSNGWLKMVFLCHQNLLL